MISTELADEQRTPIQPTGGKLFHFLGHYLSVLWKDWPRDMKHFWRSYEGKQKHMLAGQCPHCRISSNFDSVTDFYSEPIDEGISLDCGVFQCPGCGGFILGILRKEWLGDGISTTYEKHYPLGGPDDSVSADIPEEIAPDFREAIRCRWIKAYNATVEMCRRAIEASCIQLGASSNQTIEAQIDWVASQGKITSGLQSVAHTIRLAGNRGAHPPRAITPEEADAVVAFTEEYFQHVYVTPARLAKHDFSKSGASKKNP
ncbi:MAG: DUF4145 domain-containing protein [Terriglobia bacterium]|jgi:hypothetical protein